MTKACGFSVGTFKGTVFDQSVKGLQCSKHKMIIFIYISYGNFQDVCQAVWEILLDIAVT